jgi:beta-galactosidase
MMEYSAMSSRLTEELDLAADHGCEWFYLFKMLPFTCGQEMDRNALLKLSGTPQPNYHKVRAWAAEHSMPGVACKAPTRVALLYDFDSSWAYWVDQWRGDLPIPERQVYPKYIIEIVYRALFEAGLGVDIVFDPIDLERYDLVVAARQFVHKSQIENALTHYVHQGGRLIVTSDLFRRNEDNAWLECVTPTYPTLIGWTGVDFPDDAAEADSWQILTHQYGKGKTIMLHREAEIDAWQQILQEWFPVSGPETSQGNVLRHSSSEEVVYDQRGAAPRATHAIA